MSTGKRRLLIILAVLIFGAAGTAFFISYNRVETIKVTGCENYNADEIKKQILTGSFDGNSVLLYLRYRYLGLKKLPYIENITIEREDSHTIHMRIYEKTLVACIKYMGQYIYFDKDGIVLKTVKEPIDNIPRVQGIDFSDFTLYERLKVEDDAIFDAILDLSQMIGKGGLDIDKIFFTANREVELEAGTVTVYLGKRDFYDEAVAALYDILPKLQELGEKGTINLKQYSFQDDVIFEKAKKMSKKKKTKKTKQAANEDDLEDTKEADRVSNSENPDETSGEGEGSNPEEASGGDSLGDSQEDSQKGQAAGEESPEPDSDPEPVGRTGGSFKEDGGV